MIALDITNWIDLEVGDFATFEFLDGSKVSGFIHAKNSSTGETTLIFDEGYSMSWGEPHTLLRVPLRAFKFAQRRLRDDGTAIVYGVAELKVGDVVIGRPGRGAAKVRRESPK